MNRELVDLYSDYLLSSPVQAGGRLFGATTATVLSDLLESSLSHDPITRFLSRQRFDSKTLWQLVKPMVRAIEDYAGVLIFDDTIEEKPYTDENELISWHFDPSKNRTVKGINLLNCVYHAQGHPARGLRTHRQTHRLPRCENGPLEAQEHLFQGRWRSYSCEELTARDKTSLDIFWLKDKSLTDLDNLPGPDDLAEEIIENLEAGLNSFREVLADLQQAG